MPVGITERGDAAIYLREWLEAAERKRVDFTIAITKAPHILLENIAILPKNLIIHATVTGWGGTTLEPGVLEWKHEIEAYLKLVRLLGPKRVVLRIDPIIPIAEGLEIAQHLTTYCEGRLRISILDLYKHIVPRLISGNDYVANALLNKYGSGIHLSASDRNEILSKFPNAEICSEPGFISTGCVSLDDYQALYLPIPIKNSLTNQRQHCSCLTQKVELLSHHGQCRHGCLYCYWE